jgi:hypothetical protein
MSLGSPYRCLPCHRSGAPLPPHSPYLLPGPTANERQRLNALASHLLDTVIDHILGTGHNAWEAMDCTTAEWVELGAYRGDGWFEREWREWRESADGPC